MQVVAGEQAQHGCILEAPETSGAKETGTACGKNRYGTQGNSSSKPSVDAGAEVPELDESITEGEVRAALALSWS